MESFSNCPGLVDDVPSLGFDGPSHISACVPVDLIERVVYAEATPQEVRQLALHATRCFACRQAWRFAKEMADEGLEQACASVGAPSIAGQFEPERTGDSSKSVIDGLRLRGTIGRVGILASAAAVALLVLRSESKKDPAPVVYRTVDGQAQLLSAFDDSEKFSYAHGVFHWPSLGERCKYEIQLFDRELSPMAQRTVAGTNRMQLDDEPGLGVATAKGFLWTVRAYGACPERVSPLIESAMQ